MGVFAKQAGEAVCPSQGFAPLSTTTLHQRGHQHLSFVLDLNISDISGLTQVPPPDSLGSLTFQAPFNEASVETLVQSIQEVLRGELKVRMAVLMSNPMYSL